MTDDVETPKRPVGRPPTKAADPAPPDVRTYTAEEVERLIEQKFQEYRTLATTANPDFRELAASLHSIAASTDRQAKEIARTVRKDNADPPKISVFSHPEGDRDHPKDALVRETFYCGLRMREDQLTPEEIDLFNQFDGSKEAKHGTWTAEIVQNGTKSQLKVMVPAFTSDNRNDLPSLVQILTILLKGEDVADPVKALKRLSAAEAEIKKLQALLAERPKGPEMIEVTVPA